MVCREVPHQADVFVVGRVHVGGHHLRGGQLLGLQQGVEAVHDADVQLEAGRAQLQLQVRLPGDGAQTHLPALEGKHTELRGSRARLWHRLCVVIIVLLLCCYCSLAFT